MRPLAFLVLGLALGAALLVAAWPSGDAAPVPRPTAGELRLASLSPALTRTVQALELESSLVGRSTYCTSVDPALPAVGDLLAIDFERLVQVHPTHVLVQAPATGVDPALARFADERGWTLVVYSKLNRIDDVEAMVRDLARRLGGAAAVVERAEVLVRSMRAARRSDAPVHTGRLLLVHDPEAIGAFGRDTYLDEMLVAFGAANAVESSGWVTLGLEDVVRLAPDGIVLVRAEPPRDGDDAPGGPLAGLGIPLVVLAHPDVHYPAPSLADVAAALRDTLARLRILAE